MTLMESLIADFVKFSSSIANYLLLGYVSLGYGSIQCSAFPKSSSFYNIPSLKLFGNLWGNSYI